MSWLNDIKSRQFDEEKKRKEEFALTVKRVREKARRIDSFVAKFLDDFGKTCWGGGILSRPYLIDSGARGKDWIWVIEHEWNEQGVVESVGFEVCLKYNLAANEFEFMMLNRNSYYDVGPRYPCTEEGLRMMLRDVYETWLKEARKYNLKR